MAIDPTCCRTCSGKRDATFDEGSIGANLKHIPKFYHAEGDCSACAIRKMFQEAEEGGKEMKRARMLRGSEIKREQEQREAEDRARALREAEEKASVCGECGKPCTPKTDEFLRWLPGVCDPCKKAREAKRRREAEERRIHEHWTRIAVHIGLELRNLDPDHPDLDRELYEKALLWDGYQFHDENGNRIYPKGDEFPEPTRYNSLLMHGPPGCGKTRIAVSLCKKFTYEGLITEFITETEFMAAVSALAVADKKEEAADLLERIKEADLLFYDDLGTSNLTEARFSRLFDMVDYRHRHGGRTVWTSNKTPKALGDWIKGFWRKQDASSKEAADHADKMLRRMFGTRAAPLADTLEGKRQT